MVHESDVGDRDWDNLSFIWVTHRDTGAWTYTHTRAHAHKPISDKWGRICCKWAKSSDSGCRLGDRNIVSQWGPGTDGPCLLWTSRREGGNQGQRSKIWDSGQFYDTESRPPTVLYIYRRILSVRTLKLLSDYAKCQSDSGIGDLLTQ